MQDSGTLTLKKVFDFQGWVTHSWTTQGILRNYIRHAVFALGVVPVIGPGIAYLIMLRKYGRRVTSFAKVKNFLLAQRDMQRCSIETRSLPYHLVLDTINACNLSCPFCPTGTGLLGRKVKRLGLEKAKRVLDAVKPHTIRADLYSWGEPFMDPDIFAITRYAHDSGIYTNIHSVLSVKKPELGRKIVESGLDCLGVTMDGLTQETLQQYRRGSNYDLVVQNIRDVVKSRRELKSKTPRIEIIFNVFKHNEHELKQLDAYAKSLGVDAVYPRRSFIFDKSFVPDNPQYKPRGPEFSDTCWFLYVTLTVEVDGETSPCDTNTGRRWKTGDIDMLEDMRGFWNGQNYQAMRAFHAGADRKTIRDLSGGKKLLCESCNFVKGHGVSDAELSPLPPSFVFEGIRYPELSAASDSE